MTRHTHSQTARPRRTPWIPFGDGCNIRCVRRNAFEVRHKRSIRSVTLAQLVAMATDTERIAALYLCLYDAGHLPGLHELIAGKTASSDSLAGWHWLDTGSGKRFLRFHGLDAQGRMSRARLDGVHFHLRDKPLFWEIREWFVPGAPCVAPYIHPDSAAGHAERSRVLREMLQWVDVSHCALPVVLPKAAQDPVIRRFLKRLEGLLQSR